MEGGWYHTNGVKDWDTVDRILDMSGVGKKKKKKTEKQEQKI